MAADKKVPRQRVVAADKKVPRKMGGEEGDKREAEALQNTGVGENRLGRLDCSDCWGAEDSTDSTVAEDHSLQPSES